MASEVVGGHSFILAGAEPIVISDNDSTWPQQFETIRDRLAAVLQGLSTSIEHVGSTAVPGLAAKPVIDLDVVIASLDELPAAIAALAKLGYVHEGDFGVRGRGAFRWPPGEPRHHLYVCTVGSEPLREHLVFRDYLRANPDVAAEYATLKRRLAREQKDDRDAYTRGKTEFIEQALQRVTL